MRAYEAYKQIDLPWLDRIPAHWRVQRAKTMFRKMRRPAEDSDEVITCFRDGEVTRRSNRRATGFTESLKEIGYQGIRKGDLVIHVMDAFAGAVGVSDSDGKGTPVYSVCTPKGDNNNYYYAHVIRIMAKNGYIQSLYRGIRERSSDFRFEVFANLYLPLPPREEQDAIVRFLDAKCAKIDRLIRLKERQIALLNEKKQIIINQAVTRGLDPNVPMKDSGVDWIGEIPEGWEVSKLKYIGVIQTGVTLGKDYPKEATSKYPYLCVANVQDGYIDLKKIKFINLPPKEAQRYFLQKGDILMTEGGDPDKLGRGSVWNNEIAHCLHQNHIFAVRMDQNKVLISFFRFVLQAQYCKEYFLLSAKQTTNLASTNKTTLSNLYVAMPSLGAQEKIVEQLDKVAALYKTKIKIIEKEILTLREYKTKIISDCVTGKLNCIAGNDTNLGENHV